MQLIWAEILGEVKWLWMLRQKVTVPEKILCSLVDYELRDSGCSVEKPSWLNGLWVVCGVYQDWVQNNQRKIQRYPVDNVRRQIQFFSAPLGSS